MPALTLIVEEIEKTLLELLKEQVLCSELPSGWTLRAKTENDPTLLLFVLEQSEEGYNHFVVVKALKVFADN